MSDHEPALTRDSSKRMSLASWLDHDWVDISKPTYHRRAS